MTLQIAVVLLIWAIALGLALLGTWAGVFHYGFPPASLNKTKRVTPPVTLLKPLKGVDEGLRDNLDSFFRLEYPEFELLFSVADRNDPAIAVVEDLIKRYPKVQAQLIRGGVEVGYNPKVNNMIVSYGQAKYDWILISDSNVRVRPDYLTRQTAYIAPGVGIVSAVVGGKYARGVGGALEKTFLNTFYARWALLSDVVAHNPIVVGKSMLFQKSVFDTFGGLRAFSRYLAEDYVAGRMIKKAGLTAVTMREPIYQYVGYQTLRSFWNRHIRWGRIRKTLAMPVFMVELLTNSIVAGLLGAWAFHAWLGIAPSLFLSLHLGLWSICDLLLMYKVEGHLDMNAPIHWIFREILQIPLWFGIAFGNTIEWRGKRLIITSGSRLRPLPGDDQEGSGAESRQFRAKQKPTPLPVGSGNQQPPS